MRSVRSPSFGYLGQGQPTEVKRRKMLHTADTDPELRDWLRFELENGSDFTRSLVVLAMKADVAEYTLLRPTLVTLRHQHPEPSSTIVNLVTDGYRVTYNDVEYPDEIAPAFNRFNAAIFDNGLPKTNIRWAYSIRNLRAPGTSVGLLALPDDHVSHPLPTQFRLKIPHIFITEKLKGLSPVDEWVLLHEMCHFKVPHHGSEFIEELRRALEKCNWSVLLGGY
jgi:hypothetical protein